ncbi:hypothetical protein BSKO_04663 [Bryopsis sp. KO-2023]|nr:hypothetical protein BSKO_04663 [Bryopsis sp. KO-2023]
MGFLGEMVFSLFGGKEELGRRREQMRRQHEEAMARVRQQKGELLQQVRENAEAEYRKYLIDLREIYPRPPYLPKDSVPTIGIMGECGTGKSTFINTILGERVAASAVGECTADPGVYQWGDVRLVDLPGGCTNKFKAQDYFQKFGIRYFDAVVCMSTDRAKQLAVDAVKHLTRNDVPTIFVLSKVEGVIRGELGFKKDRTEEDVFEEMQTKYNGTFSQYNCPVYFVSAIEVLKEYGSLEAAGSRETPLTRLVNKDWLPLLDAMKREAIARKEFLS